jgi:hypothetical protein
MEVTSFSNNPNCFREEFLSPVIVIRGCGLSWYWKQNNRMVRKCTSKYEF